MSKQNQLLVGTGKGLILFEKKGDTWTYQGDVFLGLPVSSMYINEWTGDWWVALAHKHWGQKLHRSVDKGKSWAEIQAPKYPQGTEVSPGKPATLRYIWAISGGGPDKKEHIFVGTEPGGLFHSTDDGKSFQLVEGLWNHPSRPDHWFGGGRDHAGIHSIAIDPRDSDHLYIGVSCAGVFESRDGGISWHPVNKGLRADYLPDPYPKVGHDPHRLLICESMPDVIWQQNHCGVFRSVDAGQNWQEVTASDGSNYYGFALGIDNQNPDRAWVIPAQSDKIRVAYDKSLFISYTEDGGKSWQTFRKGLPQQSCYDIVLRHALAVDGDALAFGTNAGNLYLSSDAGLSWQCISHSLPKITTVNFA